MTRMRRMPDVKRQWVADGLWEQWGAWIECGWRVLARPEQLPPSEDDWRLWFVMAGRGFGKTRAGAEWIDACARADGRLRIALVGASFDDVRNVMIEGESGILACAPGRRRPIWSPALRRLVWPGGAMARCYSAAEPEGLRGPAHHIGWADEVARWDVRSAGAGGHDGSNAGARSRGEMAWDNLVMGMRLGERPQLCATTTPRAVPLVRRILATPGVSVSGGSTLANRDNLSGSFITDMLDQYGDTSWGRQEIGGELIVDVAGALWTRGGIEACRIEACSPPPAGGLSRSQASAAVLAGLSRSQASAAVLAGLSRSQASTAGASGNRAFDCARIVIGVDPPASSGGDACGIVVCGGLSSVDRDGVISGPFPLAGERGEGARYVVLEDATVEKASPARWARAVAEAAMRWGADRIVAEANNGGEMVRRVIDAEAIDLPVVLVHARGSKAARAEPVSIAYARGRVAHAGVFALLEDEMCGLIAGGGYVGPGRSPDRADALVWALSELMAAERQGGPRMRML